jgi:tetratricopeptide (TPR) repeat protein
MTRNLAIAFVVSGLVSMCSGVAVAQTVEETAQAQTLFERALAAAQAGEIETALPLFQQSYDLFPYAGTLFNLAFYNDQAGRQAEALAAWRELLERYGADISDESRTHAEQQIAALEPAVPEPEVEPEVEVEAEAEAEAETEPLPSPPGVDQMDQVDQMDRSGSLGPLPLEGPEPEPRPRRSFWRSPWTWIVGGVLLAGTAAGLAAGLSQPDYDGVSYLR